jgi:predicted DNA-binding transcriptional regulator AlpA
MAAVKVDSELLERMTYAVEQLSRQNLIERRIGLQEFAHMLNIEPETLDSRIRDGRYNKPFRDGRKSYWLLSYVQSVVTNTTAA